MSTESQFLHRPRFRIMSPALLFAWIAFVAAPLFAEDAGQATRAVRLGFVQGQVKISQGNQVIADPAPVNSPLFEGTQVTAGDDGRAEIQFEDGSVARLSPNSSLTLGVLRQENGGNATEIILQRGLGYFELQAAGGTDQIRVRFDDTVVTGSGFTVLRLNLDNAPGEIAVFSGNAHVERGGGLALDLHGGESVALNTTDPSTYNLTESIEPDSWDAWNADRDKALQAEFAARTAATNGQPDNNNPAWADLDANGNWYNVPGQGYVWSPYDAANQGWDPYGNGNWMWTPGYNYIWVSGDPWGYMPYQCGTWNYYSAFGWGWNPGMGYCQPWWGLGGWNYRIGYGPFGYRFPIRPHPRPIQPRPGGGRLNQAGKAGPYPLIAVNRRPAGGTQLQARNAPVTINGHTVPPLRPVVSRQPYDRQGNGFLSHSGGAYQGYRPNTAPANQNGARPGYVPLPRPSGGQPIYTTSRPSGGQPTYTPSRVPSGGSAPRASAPSGGGGGAAHASAGGGGGGAGGGSHGGGGGSSSGGHH